MNWMQKIEGMTSIVFIFSYRYKVLRGRSIFLDLCYIAGTQS